MRILDESADKKLDRVMIYFTKEEASEMKDSLELLLSNKTAHYHINDESFEKEITISLYSKEDLSHFDARSKKLIEEDK